MTTISDNDLMNVTGGKGPDATTVTPSAGGSNNDAVLGALNGIQSSLKDLGKNNNNGLFSGNNGMMFGMMAGLALSRRNNTDVVVHGSWGPRRGFSWRAYW